MTDYLQLRHDNGELRNFEVRCGIFKKDWKHARSVLVIKWPLCGEYAFDLKRDNLYNFGLGGGLRKMPLGWHAVDIKEAWNLWYRITENGRNLIERQKRELR